jgi:predicted nucleic acid-binding protein
VARLLFPDNTVLVNFAIISRLDLLSRLANGKGQWCATVARECAQSAREPGLAALAGAGEIFGEPLYPDSAELQDTAILRDELAGPGDSRNAHLGEAETLAIILRRRPECLFVTDDRDATRLASKHAVRVVNTWSLLLLAYKMSWVDGDTLWGYLQTLRSQRRGAPAGVTDRPSFDKWAGTPRGQV